jgi:N-sulfoglucosamine sulfohydrolase
MRNLIILFFVVISFSCKQQKHPEPNILWISCEDISPAWGCYGDEQATTPNIDKLSTDGYIFTQAFSNAPICAPARSTLISGMYATSLGTQNLRSEIPVSANLKILPELLREQGYFTTNNAKTDYNFSAEGRWDENGNEAHWRNRPVGKPFFSVFNFGITHEGHTNTDNPDDTKSLTSKHSADVMKVPPYLPDTEEFRSIMAHQYDLITVFDQEVGKLLNELKEDGLYENTIVFVFSDHGYGLPRYKRWLYNTGLQVPFVLHVPEKYKALAPIGQNGKVDQMVGFVDFAPSVLELTGNQMPKMMEGQSFLGNSSINKELIFGYRDRADDVNDMSRSAYDGRYLYIRNYMPQRPYIQNAIIFNKGKRSYEELFRVRELGELSDEQMKLFQPKNPEELYDLVNDPNELNNLIDDKNHMQIVTRLHEALKKHVLDTHDTGLLNEGDMMSRADGGSVYEMMHNSDLNLAKILNAAELVGKIESLNELDHFINDEDAAVRFWALQAIDAFDGDISTMEEALKMMVKDPSIPNRAIAAEILINKLNYDDALLVLREALKTEDLPLQLQVAISIRNIGEKAEPLIPLIQDEIYPKISGEVWGRYKNWFYPMFIGMALDQTLINCGVDLEIIN